MSLIFICKSLSAISDDTLTGLVPNVASLSKHVSDIVRDDRIINNDIIGLIETHQFVRFYFQTNRNIEFFRINFNGNVNKLLSNKSLSYRCGNDVAVLDKFDAIRSFKISKISKNQLMEKKLFRCWNFFICCNI